MGKKIFLIFLTGLTFITGKSQLVNDGATITIQAGASIVCLGNVENKNSGTITNDGKLEVRGNFLNSATYTSTTLDDSLLLTGSGNVTLNGGSSVYTNLWINKTNPTDFVTLTASISVSGKLDYDQGTFTTDPIANPSYLFSAPVSAVFDITGTKEIIGRVRRTGWANGAAVVFNQPNMQVTTSGGTAPTDFTVTMIPESAGGDPTLAEREVKRKFGFVHTGGSGFTANIRYPYLDPELNTNTEANLVPWQLVSSVWNGRLTPVTRDGSSNYVSTTGLTIAELANEWKLADPRYTMIATALLRGSWTAGPNMTTSLNSGGIIPLSQPYNVTPFNYTGTENVASIPNANIVDWVLLELRKPTSGLPQDALSGTLIGRKAGFLLNNGSVVDLDGVTPISFDINKQGAAFMAVRHRNHLGVLSISLPSNATGTYTNDYRVLANSYKATGTSSDPVILLAGGVHYGLWAGDANKSGNLAASDVNAVKLAIASSATGYQLTDVNLTANIAASDINLVKLMIAASATGSLPGRPAPPVRTNLPDPLGPDE